MLLQHLIAHKFCADFSRDNNDFVAKLFTMTVETLIAPLFAVEFLINFAILAELIYLIVSGLVHLKDPSTLYYMKRL